MKLNEPIPSGVAFPLVSQLVVFVLSTLILDGGQIARFVIVAILAHWLTYATIAIRRQKPFTAGDRWMMRFGFWLYLPVAVGFFVAGSLIRARGSWVY
jgi:hypothetical protein